MTSCTVSRNNAVTYAAGVLANTATLTDSTVSDNRAEYFAGGIGAGTVNLTRSTVSGNSAGSLAGGINATTVNATSSTVSGNTSGGHSGGINAVTAKLTSSTVSGNLAGRDGGGIYAGKAILINSTVSGNLAANNGGGIVASGLTLLSCTIAMNVASSGGGVFHGGSGVATVKNTIIALNHARAGLAAGNDVVGAFTSQGHNLVGDGTASTGFGSKGDQVGTAQQPIDPGLAPLAFNGGPTMTHALLPGSRAIDHGDNNGAPTTDQRGVARPTDGDGSVAVVDIGAFEL